MICSTCLNQKQKARLKNLFSEKKKLTLRIGRTLQWKGLNLYSKGRVLKISSFEGPRILRVGEMFAEWVFGIFRKTHAKNVFMAGTSPCFRGTSQLMIFCQNCPDKEDLLPSKKVHLLNWDLNAWIHDTLPPKIYGSVENGDVSNSSFLSFKADFTQLDDYGRKGEFIHAMLVSWNLFVPYF